MRHIFIILLLLAHWLTPVFAAANGSQPQDWIIDSDAGPDDLIALVYLLNQPQIRIKAITIEGDGTAHCRPAFATITGLLKKLGQSGIPVACGRARPLHGRHHFPKAVLTASDHFIGTLLPPVRTTPPQKTAKNLLIETLKNATRPVTLLAIGPLTTLAEVFEEQPPLKHKIRQIYIMGGAIRVPGNIQAVATQSGNRHAEWNIYLDPAAADRLFRAGLALTLVPLDVTNQVAINPEFYRRLEQQRHTASAELVYALLSMHKKKWTDEHWYFWDPMAAVIGVKENLARFERLPLSVTQTPENESGAIVIDPRHGNPVRVSMGIQVENFQQALIDGLNEHSGSLNLACNRHPRESGDADYSSTFSGIPQ